MKLLLVLLLFASTAALADEPVGFARGMRLFTRYHCDACHALDAPKAGPSLRAIARRYASDPHAADELAANILNGSVGAWGAVPMPPRKVPAAPLKSLVEWILSLGQP